MTKTALARFAQLLIAAGFSVACASGPSLRRTITVAAGKPTAIRLVTGSGKLALSLQNESAGYADQVYSATAADPSKKVVPDADLQALLDVFSEKGMFDQALASAPGDARDVLVVEHEGRRWIWVRRQLGVQASEQDFHEARAYFLSLYNSSVAFHGTGSQRPDFRGESARVHTDAAAARTRLEELRRRSQ